MKLSLVNRRVLLATAMALAAPQALAASPVPLADHHMHIRSSVVTEHLREMRKKSSALLGGVSDDILKPATGEDAISELDRAGIRQGLLLSTAYMFGFYKLAYSGEELVEKTRAENRFNVDAALASKGRLIAFIGVNPLAANALDELAYWTRQPGASGVKLHLGNSGFDATDPAQVEKLAAFVAAASKANMPLVIHTRGGAVFNRSTVETLIDEVISQAGDLPIQIAHGGGYAGIDGATLDSLSAYGDAIARKAPGTRNLLFDLAVVANFDSTQLPGNKDEARTPDELKLAYVAEMRRVGLDRFVLASDWPGTSAPAEYFAAEQKALPVTSIEWAQLCKNLAPWFRPGWKSGLR